jgi:3-oxoacyl-[acyl-carrier-protein] synthase III
MSLTATTLPSGPQNTRSSNIEVVIPIPRRQNNTTVTTTTREKSVADDDDDDELSEQDIARLLKEAEERMRGDSMAVLKTNGLDVNSIKSVLPHISSVFVCKTRIPNTCWQTS